MKSLWKCLSNKWLRYQFISSVLRAYYTVLRHGTLHLKKMDPESRDIRRLMISLRFSALRHIKYPIFSSSADWKVSSLGYGQIQFFQYLKNDTHDLPLRNGFLSRSLCVMFKIGYRLRLKIFSSTYTNKMYITLIRSIFY